MDFESIRRDEQVLAFIKKGNDNLAAIGYTDHGVSHCTIVAERAAQVLSAFGYSEHEVELARIAGFMHDIGNAVNRSHHAEYGALLAGEILKDAGMPLSDRVSVMSTIANHDESTGSAVDVISAAVILADKTDVRRNRVRNTDIPASDIHDRVNYAVTDAELCIDREKAIIELKLMIDESICTMFDYFEIFLGRMLLCRRAAELLGARFRLSTNGSKIL